MMFGQNMLYKLSVYNMLYTYTLNRHVLPQHLKKIILPQKEIAMKLLFGTGNAAKLSVMRNRLKKIDIELIGLNDLRAEGMDIPEVAETGSTPLENARIKALAYYKAFNMPFGAVF